MAKRISVYVERYKLLPNAPLGGGPGRSREQELLILVDATWKVWRKHKFVTPMAFDIKGTLSSVDRTVSGEFLGKLIMTLE
jgi:hypothetical protein